MIGDGSSAVLCAVTSRAKSLELGLLACRSLPWEEALVSIRVMLCDALTACQYDTVCQNAHVFAGVAAESRIGVLLLLRAERYWLETLAAILENGVAPGEVVLGNLLSAFPRPLE